MTNKVKDSSYIFELSVSRTEFFNLYHKLKNLNGIFSYLLATFIDAKELPSIFFNEIVKVSLSLFKYNPP